MESDHIERDEGGMAICINKLIPHPNSFKLEEQTDFSAKDTDLTMLLSEFLARGDRGGIHIAVVCGSCNIWTSEQLAQFLKEKNPFEKSIIAFDKNEPVIVHAAMICATTDKIEKDTNQLMGPFFSDIKDVLYLLYKKLEANDDNGQYIEAAKDKMSDVFGILMYLSRFPEVNLASEDIAQSITELLSDNAVKNGFPTVKLLIFLPEEAFEKFNDDRFFFFNQIECVLRIMDANQTRKYIVQLKHDREAYEKKIVELQRIVNSCKECKDGDPFKLDVGLILNLFDEIKQLKRAAQNIAMEEAQLKQIDAFLTEELKRGRILLKKGESLFSYSDIFEVLLNDDGIYINELEGKWDTTDMDFCGLINLMETIYIIKQSRISDRLTESELEINQSPISEFPENDRIGTEEAMQSNQLASLKISTQKSAITPMDKARGNCSERKWGDGRGI